MSTDRTQRSEKSVLCSWKFNSSDLTNRVIIDQIYPSRKRLLSSLEGVERLWVNHFIKHTLRGKRPTIP